LTVLFAAIAAACFVLFYRQEHRAPRPIIDFTYFRDLGFAITNAANSLVNLAAFAIMLLAPFYLARIPGLSLPQAGFVLASSPFAMIFAAPLAGRLAKGVSPHRIAVAGSAMSSLGLFGIALAGGHPALVWLIAAMAVQGFGVGLFQVAYFDIITGVIPPRNRGVAGALGMATRSIGTVTGATVLMLIFQILRAAGGEGGFTGAFQATFAVAGGINAMVTLVQVLGRRGTPRD